MICSRDEESDAKASLWKQLYSVSEGTITQCSPRHWHAAAAAAASCSRTLTSYSASALSAGGASNVLLKSGPHSDFHTADRRRVVLQLIQRKPLAVPLSSAPAAWKAAQQHRAGRVHGVCRPVLHAQRWSHRAAYNNLIICVKFYYRYRPAPIRTGISRRHVKKLNSK